MKLSSILKAVPYLLRSAVLASFLSLPFSLNSSAAISEADIEKLTQPDTSHPGITVKGEPQDKGNHSCTTYEYTNNYSELAACGFVGEGLETHSHPLTLLQPKGWNKKRLILLINGHDGVDGHIQPDDMMKELADFPWDHDAFGQSCAVLEYRNPLPPTVEYTPKAGGEKITITKPLGRMMCSWIHYQKDKNEEILAEMQVIKSLRTLIGSLEDAGIKPEEIWVAGYQIWGRLALMARAIPEVKHVLVMGYERTELTTGLSAMTGSSVGAGLKRAAAIPLMTSSKAQAIGSVLSQDTVEGIKKLIGFSDCSILVDLTNELGDAELAGRILESEPPAKQVV